MIGQYRQPKKHLMVTALVVFFSFVLSLVTPEAHAHPLHQAKQHQTSQQWLDAHTHEVPLCNLHRALVESAVLQSPNWPKEDFGAAPAIVFPTTVLTLADSSPVKAHSAFLKDESNRYLELRVLLN